MKIGIDIDNTILNTLPILKKYINNYIRILDKGYIMNENGFCSSNLCNWVWEDEYDFCLKYLELTVSTSEIFEHVKEVVELLKENGHEIHFITARSKPHFKDPYKISEATLKRKEIPYDYLVVECSDKRTYCKANGIELLIDDEPHNIIEVAKDIPVIVLKGLQNEKCIGNNVVKVNDWYEIEMYFREHNIL